MTLGRLGELLDEGLRRCFNATIGAFDTVMRQAVKSERFYKLIYHRFVNRLSRAFVPQVPSRVQTEDWKYLIVLDACRYDRFAEKCSLEGDLKEANSYSGWTREWAIRNFSEGDYSDTLYISASAWPSVSENWIGKVPFFAVDDVWEYEWDDEVGGIPPDVVREAAIKNVAAHPEKRAVIHFQQPHAPFLADVRLDYKGTNPYHALRRGEVSQAELRAAYDANLEAVLEEVAKLLPYLDDRVVITSDHGECFGELNLFGHPGALVPPILEVPWFVIEKSREANLDDVDVKRDPTADDDKEALREQRLRDLGYL